MDTNSEQQSIGSEEAKTIMGQESAPRSVSSPKDAYEQRRAEKRASQEVGAGRGASSGAPARLLRPLVWLVVAAVALYGLYALVRNNTPQTEDMSRAIPIMGQEHISVDAEHEAYNSNPPTSGPHYDTPAHPGFREEAIADENLVHSLEHGLIWIAYHPRIGESAREALRDIAGSWVVVTAREANEHDIALAAWGWLDAFNLEGGVLDEVAEQRISDFIARYRGRGPEKIPAGQHGGI